MSKPLPPPAYRPLYEQIKILITQSLVAGEWKPGEAIPSEIELAARFRVSQGTVRKAIDELASEHILVRRQGKGTFVASHAEPSYQYRFLRVMPDSGEKLHPQSTFVDLRRGRASAEVAKALAIKAGSPVHVIRRLLHFRGRPLILDEMVLGAARFPALTMARLEEYRGSMYSFYEAVYGLRMIRAEERLRAVPAEAGVAGLLRVDAGTPLLCVDRIAYTYGDAPVEWRRGLCLTDGFSYYTELA
ncbi:MAG TPA: GntR family transcriptional regulator [Usitatibacteraceae bacterium]|nr:GntR family transcriptional regulator [Usitatibacteraceae bacterium]